MRIPAIQRMWALVLGVALARNDRAQRARDRPRRTSRARLGNGKRERSTQQCGKRDSFCWIGYMGIGIFFLLVERGTGTTAGGWPARLLLMVMGGEKLNRIII